LFWFCLISHWFTWFSFMGHSIKRFHLDCLRGIISGLEVEECPEKSKQWLLRTDTVFLLLIFPLQEVVTTRTTLLVLKRMASWHGMWWRLRSRRALSLDRPLIACLLIPIRLTQRKKNSWKIWAVQCWFELGFVMF